MLKQGGGERCWTSLSIIYFVKISFLDSSSLPVNCCGHVYPEEQTIRDQSRGLSVMGWACVCLFTFLLDFQEIVTALPKIGLRVTVKAEKEERVRRGGA
jgi:hypothetical protein